jgi:hypothetical protein
MVCVCEARLVRANALVWTCLGICVELDSSVGGAETIDACLNLEEICSSDNVRREEVTRTYKEKVRSKRVKFEQVSYRS